MVDRFENVARGAVVGDGAHDVPGGQEVYLGSNSARVGRPRGADAQDLEAVRCELAQGGGGGAGADEQHLLRFRERFYGPFGGAVEGGERIAQRLDL